MESEKEHPKTIWGMKEVRAWGRRGPVARLLAGQLKMPESREISDAWRRTVQDQDAYRFAAQASTGGAEEAFWFFRGDEFADLHVPPSVLEDVFRSVGELPCLDVTAPEAQGWLDRVIHTLLPIQVRWNIAWELMKLLPRFAKEGRCQEAWMLMMAAKDLEEKRDKSPVFVKAILQESMVAWSEEYDISLSHAIRFAGVDFSSAPGYGTDRFDEWVRDAMLQEQGKSSVIELLRDKLGTSEAVAREVQRIAAESLAVLEDPAFEKNKMVPVEAKALAKQLRKRRLDLIQGRSPRVVLEEIYGKKSEDYFPPKRKKKLMAALEEYLASLKEDQGLERFRCQIALELMQREVDAKNPFLLEYVLGPALVYYEENYASKALSPGWFQTRWHWP